MAIDPQISLGIRPPAPLDLSRFQQLRNLAMQEEATRQQIAASQASEALSRAQLPGVEAESEIKQRAVRFNRDVLGNPQEFTNPDGSFNTQRFRNYALSKGYQREGQAIFASELENAGQVVANARSEQDKQIALSDFNNKQTTGAAMVLHALPENQRASALQTLQQYSNNLVPGSGDNVVKLFGEVDDKTGMVKVNPARVKAVRDATITAFQQDEMAYQKAKDLYFDEANNPNSTLTNEFRKHAADQGVPLPPGLSMFQYQRMGYGDTVRGFIEKGAYPQEMRAEGMRVSADASINIANLRQAEQALSQVRPQDLPTVAGSTVDTFFKSRVLQDPAYAAFRSAVSAYNNLPENKDNPITDKMTVEQAKKMIDQAIDRQQTRGKVGMELAGRVRLPTESGRPALAPAGRKMLRFQPLDSSGRKAGPEIEVPENEVSMAESAAAQRKLKLVPVGGKK